MTNKSQTPAGPFAALLPVAADLDSRGRQRFYAVVLGNYRAAALHARAHRPSGAGLNPISADKDPAASSRPVQRSLERGTADLRAAQSMGTW